MQPGSDEEQWREDCAPRRVLELFSTKWTSMILHTLHARHGGTARSGALHRSLPGIRSEEHTSELQSLMRISYAVFCLKKKNNNNQIYHTVIIPNITNKLVILQNKRTEQESQE